MAAALYGVPAVVWASITRRSWWYARLVQPRSLAFRLAPIVGGAFLIHYALLVALTLAPIGVSGDPWHHADLETGRIGTSPMHLAHEVSWLACIALLGTSASCCPYRSGGRAGVASRRRARPARG